MPEGVVHGEPLGLGGGDQRIITSDKGNGHPFFLLGQRFLQLETAGQVNRIKASQGMLLAQLGGAVNSCPMGGKELVPCQEIAFELPLELVALAAGDAA